MMADSSNDKNNGHLVFVYGTLKHGFYNNYLISGSEKSSKGVFVGVATTVDPFVLVVDDRGIPFLLSAPPLTSTTAAGAAEDKSFPISGELYRVQDDLFAELDVLEGYPHFYTRRQVPVALVRATNDDEQTPTTMTAWVYIKADGNPEENAMFRLREHVQEYTPDMHLHYIPPPMRVPAHSIRILAQARRAFETMTVRTSLCHGEHMVLTRSFKEADKHVAATSAQVKEAEVGSGEQAVVVEEDDVLLDAGCGSSLLVPRAILSEFPHARIMCVDGSPAVEQHVCEAVAQMEKDKQTQTATQPSSKVGHISFLCTDLCELGVALGHRSFKMVSCLGTIFHTPRSLHRHVILGLYRALLPGGVLVLGLASSEMDNVPIKLATTEEAANKGNSEPIGVVEGLLCSQYHPDAYVALLEESGFVVQERNDVPESQVVKDTSTVLPLGIGSQVWLAYKPHSISTR